MPDMVELDEFDRKIVAILRREGRISITDLAPRVGLSKTPCQIRLKRLLAEGVIRGFEAVVDPAKLGMEHVAFTQVRLSDTREQALQEFGAAVRIIPEVEECHMIAANFDYLLKVRTENTGTLDRLLVECLRTIPGVTRTDTTIVLASVKEDTFVSVAKKEGSVP